MSHNIYIYILVMAGVSYLIRMLPLTLIRKEIKNKIGKTTQHTAMIAKKAITRDW